jgi:hypothetical protein
MGCSESFVGYLLFSAAVDSMPGTALRVKRTKWGVGISKKDHGSFLIFFGNSSTLGSEWYCHIWEMYYYIWVNEKITVRL